MRSPSHSLLGTINSAQLLVIFVCRVWIVITFLKYTEVKTHFFFVGFSNITFSTIFFST